MRELERLAGETRDSREQLALSEEKYRRICEHSPSAYALQEIVTDEDGEPIDGVLLEVDREFEILTGTRAEEVLGERVSRALPALRSASFLEVFGRVVRTRQPLRFELYSEDLGKYLDVSVYSPRPGQVATILFDNTAKQETEEALRLRTAYFKELFERSPLGIVLLDNHDRVVECNGGFESLFGFKREEARGQEIDTLIVRPDQRESAHSLSRQVLRGEIVDAEAVRCRKDGSSIDVHILAHPIHLGERQIGIYGIYSDISRRKRDSLTRLVNRTTFMERLADQLARGTRRGEMTAVLSLDLDQLKDVNDTYGLSVGDSLLQAVAQRLRESLRAGASMARLGGDEFGVMQYELHDVGNAAGLARRLLAALAEPLQIGHHLIHVSASVGIAVASPGRESKATQLVSQAERALAMAKREGSGTIKFHAAAMDLEVQDRMILGQELHRAVERQELFLEYQPQVALPEGRVVGVEALVRWRRADGSIIGPARFVPVAEASGIITAIGDWVLRSACAQAVEWQRQRPGGLPIAVNLSAVQFKNPHFAETVTEALASSGLSPELLELELTERILVDSSRRFHEALRKLRQLGVRLTLDDFGTGYSSLEYLRRLPLQKLKIDRSFVENLDGNSSDAAIVSAIAVLGSKLGLRVLAEGVERRSQLDRLAAEGCHEIQGFYYSPPLAAEALTELIQRGDGIIRPADGAARSGGSKTRMAKRRGRKSGPRRRDRAGLPAGDRDRP